MVEDGGQPLRGEGPDGGETYRVPLPAVATILEGGVEPRYPSMSGRIKAKKIPIEQRAGAGRSRRDRAG